MKPKVMLLIVCLIGLNIFTMKNLQAQIRVYADAVVNSSSDFQNSALAVDADVATNFAYLSTSLGVLTNSSMQVRFPSSRKAGDFVNVQIQGGGVLNTSLLNSITLKLYDSLGTNVATVSGSTLLQLDLLSATDNIYTIRYLTDPNASYTFKEVRIELANTLALNLLSQFKLYDVFSESPCATTYANSVYTFGASTSATLLSGYVTNPGNAVDTDVNTYATLTVPLNLLGILPPAYLDVNLAATGKAGDYVGFTVSQSNTLLALSLLQNVSITAYDNSNNVVASKANFTLADLKLLGGSTNKYTLGFMTPAGSYNIARLRINVTGVLAALIDLNVNNAFDFSMAPSPLTISTSGGSSSFCNNGSITLSTNAPTTGSTFSWSNGASTPTITVNQTGTYSVTVNNSSACISASVPVAVTKLPVLPINTVVTNVNCSGQNNGSISATPVAAGTYTYSWNVSGSGSSITNLAPANYTLAITDVSNSCVSNYNFQIADAAPLAINSTVTNVKCNGQNNGSISATPVAAGTYTYSWNTGASSSSVINLSPATYTLAITDVSISCVSNYTFQVTEPVALTLKGSTVAVTCGGKDGKVLLSPLGGTAPYSYSCSEPIQNNQIANINAGTYNVSITDANACTQSGSFIVTKVDCNVPINIHNVITPNEDGLNDVLVIEGIEKYPANTLQVYNKWGDVVYEEENYRNHWTGMERQSSGYLPAGTYFYLLKLNAAEVPQNKGEYTGFLMIQR